MSFWKQLPPNPTDACRNFGPMRLSSPTARATSDTSAPVASHTADSELMEEMRWARNAFAASLDSSELQLLDRSLTLGCLLAPDQHPVGLEQILHRGTFGEKLRIREDVILDARFVVGLQDVHDAFGCPHRDRAFLHHDLAVLRHLGDHAGATLDVFEVSRTAPPIAVRFCGRVDGDEDQLRFLDRFLDVGGEEQVAVAALADHFVEAGLVVEEEIKIGDLVRVPLGYPLGATVDDRDLDVGALERHHAARRPANVTSADAANFGNYHRACFRFLFFGTHLITPPKH
uniref:Uncharacterized protein n=1 Tax=Anopheles coluzzii TaxID=1518534 RepID=A0A8W7PYL8_ANOCL